MNLRQLQMLAASGDPHAVAALQGLDSPVPQAGPGAARFGGYGMPVSHAAGVRFPARRRQPQAQVGRLSPSQIEELRFMMRAAAGSGTHPVEAVSMAMPMGGGGGPSLLEQSHSSALGVLAANAAQPAAAPAFSPMATSLSALAAPSGSGTLASRAFVTLDQARTAPLTTSSTTTSRYAVRL